MRVRELLSEYQFRPMIDGASEFHSEAPEFNQDWGEFTEKVREKLEAHCSEVIAMYQRGRNPLYRGCRETEHPLFRARIPRKIDLPITSAANELLINAGHEAGVHANFHESIICNSDPHRVVDDGMLYIVFPMNGFRYTWSKKYHDLVKGIGANTRVDLATLTTEDPVAYETVREALTEADFVNSNFADALATHHDVAITGVDYYGLKSRVWRKYITSWWGF
jgi:hypothetical protein